MSDKEDGSRLSCVDCVTGACLHADAQKAFPSFCLTKNLDKKRLQKCIAAYDERENHAVMQSAAECEAQGKITRVEETIRFSKAMGVKRLGIAHCVGLKKEANILAKILRSHGFEVFGVACKCGTVKKSEIGLDVLPEQEAVTICDPILQAQLLAERETELNILVGLCVGHDSLFCKYSQALTTTLISKDKCTGHNPAVVLYQLDSVFPELMGNDA